MSRSISDILNFKYVKDLSKVFFSLKTIRLLLLMFLSKDVRVGPEEYHIHTKQGIQHCLHHFSIVIQDFERMKTEKAM